MKSNLILVLAAFFGMLAPLQSQAAEKPTLSGSFTTQLNTAYIGKIGAIFDKAPTSVNYLDVNLGSDWTVELWSSTHLGKGKYGSTYGDEFDIFLNYHHSFDDFHVSLTAGYFFIKDLGDLASDLWMLEGEVSYTKCKYFQPYISARYFGQVSSESFQQGWFGWAGVRGTYPTPWKCVALKLDASIAYSDGALGKDAGFVYGRAVVSMPVQVSKRVEITPSILLQTPIGNQRQSQLSYTNQNEAVASLSVGISF